MARLAEAAAAYAAPEQLKADTVVHHLGRRDHGPGREGRGIQILHDALEDLRRSAVLRRHGGHLPVPAVAHLVQGGHIHAPDSGGAAEKVLLAPAFFFCLPQQGQDLVVDLFALADDEQVDKGRHRLGVDSRRAPCPDQREKRRTLRTAQGQARHVQHVQHGRIGHLVADGKGDRIEGRQRIAALQGVEGDAGLLHLGIHVAPGCKNALAPDEGQAVHRLVQNAHTQIGHADLIGVRKTEGKTQLDRVPVLQDLIVFPARVTGRFLNPGKNPLESFIHAHSAYSS